MNEIDKQRIAAGLRMFCQHAGSQSKAANMLRAISSATISQMQNNNWEQITDEMWRNVESQIDLDAFNWMMVKTRAFDRLNTTLTDAQQNSLVVGVVGDAGCGKTATIKHYAAHNPNVLRLSCSEFWNRKKFLCELLRAAGMSEGGATIAYMMDEVVLEIKRKNKPLIILDEADKLSDQVLFFFITLYNELEDRCGLVLCATDYLESRIKRGVKHGRKGYREIFSRLGRKFIPLQIVNSDDVAAICMANGIKDTASIDEIVVDSESDLRRVKRKIHAIKQKQQQGGERFTKGSETSKNGE